MPRHRLVAFVIASYLVNMTFINAELERQGNAMRVPFPPSDVPQFVAVVSAGLGIMDLVFLGILVWQAWVIPRPPQIPSPVPA